MNNKVILGSGRELGSTYKIAWEINEWLLTVSESMILNHIKDIPKNYTTLQIDFLFSTFCLLFICFGNELGKDEG